MKKLPVRPIQSNKRILAAFGAPLATALAILFAGVSASHSAKTGGEVQADTAFDAAPSDPRSSYLLALRYLNGDGVPKDEQRAFDMVWLASEAGDAEAFGTLGYFFASGVIVEKNPEKARYYFEQGAEKGSAAAQMNLGQWMLRGKGGAKNLGEGIAWLEKAAAQGSVTARLALGEAYYHGDHAEGHADFKKAYEVYLPLAEQGNPLAANVMGVLLQGGLAGKTDKKMAREWFEKAATQGNAKACSNLGHLIDFESPDRDTRIEALKWLLVARAMNEQTAIVTLENHAKVIKADEFSAAQVLAEELRKSLPNKQL